MALPTSIHSSSPAALAILGVESPIVFVVLLSFVTGLLMVVVFRYTSDQEAIRVAKDHLKAHLLAVRLFQDQLPVVLSSYGRIVVGTGRYLRLALKPLLFVILPLTLLMIQLDRYLGWTPLVPGRAFLVKARAENAQALDVSLLLPPEMAITAPAVHVPSDDEVLWRIVAAREGRYQISIAAASQSFSKEVVVSSRLLRVSPIRLQGYFWKRMLTSGEPALPPKSPLLSVEVNYPSRNIRFAGLEWSWIWLFFVLSLVAGFFFKTALKIEI